MANRASTWIRKAFSNAAYALFGVVAGIIASHAKHPRSSLVLPMPADPRRRPINLLAMLTGRVKAAIVDPDEDNRNAVAGGDFPAHEYSTADRDAAPRRVRGRSIPPTSLRDVSELDTAPDDYPDRTLNTLTRRFSDQNRPREETAARSHTPPRQRTEEYKDAVRMREPSPSRHPEAIHPHETPPNKRPSEPTKSNTDSPHPVRSLLKREGDSVRTTGSKTLGRIKSLLTNRTWDGGKTNLFSGSHLKSVPPPVRLEKEPEKPNKKSAAAAAKGRLPHASIKPPGMREMLGTGLIRPPEGKLVPPDFAKRGLNVSAPTPEELEKLKPPVSKTKINGDQIKHVGQAWSIRSGQHWAQLISDHGRWWTEGGNGQPLLWHAGHWWWKTQDGWFLLHDGQPWAFREFHELKMEGLLQTSTGVRVVYSSDGRRAAILSPEGETVLYDLQTGKEIGRWQKRKPDSEPAD